MLIPTYFLLRYSCVVKQGYTAFYNRNMEAGKCYKVFFPGSNNIYIFKVKEVTREKYCIFNNVTLYSSNIKIVKGFKKIDNKILRLTDTSFPESYIVQEVEEKDIDKLEHYYKMMENAFNSIINKYK